MNDVTYNLFSYAPKELTNSAMWAWIFSAIRENNTGNPRYKIALNIFNILGISAPDSKTLAELHTEKTFSAIHKDGVGIAASNKRMDVFLRVSGSDGFVLFIENKVVEKDVSALLKQIREYDDRFRQIQSAFSDYARIVYPAYFGYEDWVADQLFEEARKTDADFAKRLKVFPISKMLLAFENTGFEQDPILSQFYNWLNVKKNFVMIRRDARLNKHADIARVISASKSAGFGHILEEFMRGFDGHFNFRSKIRLVRTDIRNINFYKKNAAKMTPLTIRWFYDSGSNGLYIGIHQDVIFQTGIDLFRGLPSDFGYEKEGKWLFGYLKTNIEASEFWKKAS